jgi:Ca2+-binding EF-hand superfamily protein
MKKILMSCAILAAGICWAVPPLDANNDGKVSLEEYIANRMASAAKQGKKIKREALVEAFKRTDTNGDGFLSAEEREAAKVKR